MTGTTLLLPSAAVLTVAVVVDGYVYQRYSPNYAREWLPLHALTMHKIITHIPIEGSKLPKLN
jgi:hypothetical protein